MWAVRRQGRFHLPCEPTSSSFSLSLSRRWAWATRTRPTWWPRRWPRTRAARCCCPAVRSPSHCDRESQWRDAAERASGEMRQREPVERCDRESQWRDAAERASGEMRQREPVERCDRESQWRDATERASGEMRQREPVERCGRESQWRDATERASGEMRQREPVERYVPCRSTAGRASTPAEPNLSGAEAAGGCSFSRNADASREKTTAAAAPSFHSL
jgi:hypothetical protein